MILHPNISPEIISFSLGPINLALRWYAVSYILGFIAALIIMKTLVANKKLWRDSTPAINGDQADSILTYLIVGVIFGGRLGYVLFYNLSYYIAHPIDIIKVWDGGMSFHGGFIGVVFAVLIYARLHNVQLWSLADLIAVASPPGLFFGRIANFINAELWGRPTEAPWGVIFPGEAAQNCANTVDPCARHPSQLYEAGLEGLCLFVILIVIVRRGALNFPGRITGFFSLGYGVSRYFIEFFRVPDQQFFSQENPLGFAYQFGNFGITMGQTLCIPMIFVGLFLIVASFLSAKEVDKR